MSSWLRITCASLTVVTLLGLGFIIGRARLSDSARPPVVSRYAFSSVGGSAFLIDTRSGDTWVLSLRKDSTLGWLRLYEVESDEVVQSHAQVPSSGSVTFAPTSTTLSWRIALEREGYTRVHLRKTNAGYLTVGAKISNRDVNFLLDTGAPNTYLDQRRSRQLGLKWESAEGASGNSAAGDPSQTSLVESIEIGSFRISRIRVGAHDLTANNQRIGGFYGDAPLDGVLGADVLDPAWAIVDYRSRDLYLFGRD
jgi:hypothetical protein